MTLEQWILAVAVATLVATVTLPLWLRWRDRVELEISTIEPGRDDTVVLTIRNRGGGRSQPVGVYRAGSAPDDPLTRWPGGNVAPVPPRGSITYRASVEALGRMSVDFDAVYVVDVDGHRSPDRAMPAAQLARVREWRRINRG